MIKIYRLILVTAFVFTACDNKTEKKKMEKSPLKEVFGKDSVHSAPIKVISGAEADILTSLPIRHFPIVDSTDFENFDKSGIHDNGFLKKINFDPKRKDATNFRLNYKVPFSEKFASIVVTYQGGEHELFTTLITIDKDSKIIDKLEIAYDEIAESAFAKTSRIEKNKIVVTNSNWMSEDPIFETETFILENDGKFKKVQAGTAQELN